MPFVILSALETSTAEAADGLDAPFFTMSAHLMGPGVFAFAGVLALGVLALGVLAFGVLAFGVLGFGVALAGVFLGDSATIFTAFLMVAGVLAFGVGVLVFSTGVSILGVIAFTFGDGVASLGVVVLAAGDFFVLAFFGVGVLALGVGGFLAALSATPCLEKISDTNFH